MERTRGWVLFCFCNGRIPKPLHAASLQPPLFPAPQRSHVKRRRQTALLAGDGMMPLCRPSRVLAEWAWDQNSREKWPGREHGEQLCALREHESCKLPQHSSTLHGRLNLLNRVYKTRERFFSLRQMLLSDHQLQFLLAFVVSQLGTNYAFEDNLLAKSC